jgi:hypothetical protein
MEVKAELPTKATLEQKETGLMIIATNLVDNKVT